MYSGLAVGMVGLVAMVGVWYVGVYLFSDTNARRTPLQNAFRRLVGLLHWVAAIALAARAGLDAAIGAYYSHMDKPNYQPKNERVRRPKPLAIQRPAWSTVREPESIA